MTAYFRKSFKVAPGVHINLSKRGTGVSFGGRGAHVSLSPTGRVTKTLNIPGTGIYYRDVDTLHAKAAHAPQSEPTTPTPHSPEPIAMRAPTTALPTAHQVVAVEHHGFLHQPCRCRFLLAPCRRNHRHYQQIPTIKPVGTHIDSHRSDHFDTLAQGSHP